MTWRTLADVARVGYEALFCFLNLPKLTRKIIWSYALQNLLGSFKNNWCFCSGASLDDQTCFLYLYPSLHLLHLYLHLCRVSHTKTPRHDTLWRQGAEQHHQKHEVMTNFVFSRSQAAVDGFARFFFCSNRNGVENHLKIERALLLALLPSYFVVFWTNF